MRKKPVDVEKTAFNTAYVRLEYLVMPIGACMSAAIFQSSMNFRFHDYIYLPLKWFTLVIS